MKQINTIALSTVKEIYRDKIYYSFFIFALLMVFITYFLGQLTYRDQDKITIDLGLAAINISGILMSIFLGATIITKEIDKKSLYMIISKPIKRYKYIFGKFFGLTTVIFINTFVMALMVIINGLILGAKIELIFYQAIILMFLEMLIMISITILFSTFTTAIMSSIFSIGFYLIAHSSSAFNTLIARSEGSKQITLKIMNFFSPNFEVLNLKNHLFQIDSIPFKIFIESTTYAILYITFFCAITIFVFSGKDFK